MSKSTFTKEQIELLKENSYVQRIIELSITYSDKFKRLFIAEYLKGKNPKFIFIDSSFDVEIIG
ncbi:HTH domain-containing protein [Clostridium butyricum]|jgi:hypothetical protein|uniref:HTH domain-containing protein n=1 Tax=Clostridium butyricum TaxID=1492 RepID=UPI003466C7C5